ncbi:MerR family transcriptional regulator [Candidatus Pacearchaeota archaeon]|nr:MerR family transcriptional regulator [Candidatus Pacearchaeota archaeon]
MDCHRMYNKSIEQRRRTPCQTVEILKISTRTLRRWSAAFKIALSETASRKGRKRFFDGHDIKTLQIAQEMLNERMTLIEIAPRLTVRTSEETTALMLPTEVSMAIGQALERTRNLVEDTKELEIKQDDQAERLEKLERWANQSWLKKLFTKPE